MQINIEKKHFWVLVVMISLIAVAVFVYAVSSGDNSADAFGHKASDISGLESGGGLDYKTWEVLPTGTTTDISLLDLDTLCGDGDGCFAKLCMQDYADSKPGLSWCHYCHFSYSAKTNWWQNNCYNSFVEGQNGDNTVKHIINIGNTCYFTDGEYDTWTGKDTVGLNLGLLNYAPKGTYDAEKCILTLID
ncbi:MAG: hypothetical protein KKA58_04985 [Nanoarchaeota archaeon]|nr:hypothetical protein [Nanoarchaeota archaeon]